MRLIDDWKKVIKKAWSIRLILLSGALTGIDVALPAISDLFPANTFAIASALIACAAAIMRVVSQPDFSVKDDAAE